MIQYLLDSVMTSERFADWLFGSLAGVAIWIAGYLGSDFSSYVVRVPIWLIRISLARSDRYNRVDLVGLTTQFGGIFLIIVSLSAWFVSSHEQFIRIYVFGLVVMMGIMVAIRWKYSRKL